VAGALHLVSLRQHFTQQPRAVGEFAREIIRCVAHTADSGMVWVSVMTLYQVTWAHYTQVGASIRSVVGLSSTSGGYTAVNICNVQIPVVPTAVNGAGIALSVQRLDTGWTVLGIESWWGRDFFRTCPDRL